MNDFSVLLKIIIPKRNIIMVITTEYMISPNSRFPFPIKAKRKPSITGVIGLANKIVLYLSGTIDNG